MKDGLDWLFSLGLPIAAGERLLVIDDFGRPSGAACLAWMAKHNKRPNHGPTSTAAWFNEGMVSAMLGEPESNVPFELFTLLTGGTPRANHRTYPSVRLALADLITAFGRAGGGP